LKILFDILGLIALAAGVLLLIFTTRESFLPPTELPVNAPAGRIAALSDAEQEELQRLLQENKELPKTRGEITALRAELKPGQALQLQWERLKKEKAAGKFIKPSERPGFISRAQIVWTGQRTPEDAVVSFFFGFFALDFEKLSQVVSEEKIGFYKQQLDWAGEIEGKKILERIPGFHLLEKRMQSPTQAEVKIHFAGQDGMLELELRETGWVIISDILPSR
jgi:hypothetical protein